MPSTHFTTYQAAKAVSGTIEAHFAKLYDLAVREHDKVLSPVPIAEHIEIILDTAFWASLRREEGLSPKISLAYVSPELATQPLLFEKRLSLSASILTKLAPGVERAGIHLGIWHQEGRLHLWGTTSIIPDMCMVVDVSEPGLLVVKHRRIDGFGKFANVAILKGDQIKIVDEQAAQLPDCPSVLTSLLRFKPTYNWDNSFNILVQLAVSMRAHKRGGLLLVVPIGSDAWLNSMVKPILYTIQPTFKGLADLVKEAEDERDNNAIQESVRKEVDRIAGLTAIDGATIINDRYELLAFGAKIGRLDGKEPINKIVITEPVVGGEAIATHPSLNGGTRHLSAAQFVQDQPDAIALVASQDGRFTIFSWSTCENVVQAHRIETLLL